MKTILFHPAAESEMIDAAKFYQGEAPGLGERFLEAVRAAVLHIARFPKAAPIVYPNEFRAFGIRTFPFHIVFREQESMLFILAIAHDRRRPGYWKTRI